MRDFLYDTFHIVIVGAAVLIIIALAVSDEVRRPHGIARPACERRMGIWTKVRRDCSGDPQICTDVMECRYRVTGRIGEMP